MMIGKYRLEGGGAMPEQYDVFLGKKQVGYLRLRWGIFRADLFHHGEPGYVRGVYRTDLGDEWQGAFSCPEQRTKYLNEAINALDKRLKQ